MQSPCFIAMRCRRSRLAGRYTCRNPTTTGPGHQTVLPTRREINHIEIPQLESDFEEEEGQFEDLQTYLTHHNTYQESQNIHKEYRKRLLDLNDDRYYQKIDCVYETYGPTRDYIPVDQAPGPHRMIQELIQTFGRGRGQACREEPHGHQPFGA